MDENLKTDLMMDLCRNLRYEKGKLPPGVDIVIDDEFLYESPINCRNLTITANGKIIVADQRVGVVINASGAVVINGVIDVKGKGWESRSSLIPPTNNTEYNATGLGYCDGGEDTFPLGTYNSKRQAGGGIPLTTRPSAFREMMGLASAQPGGFMTPYGAGAASNGNGGGGGAGSDGAPGFGGGTGAGGGGGTTGNGSAGTPRGGKGSQADPVVNLNLFKQRLLEEIPLFGAGGGGWSGLTVFGGFGGGNIQIYATSITIGTTAILDASGNNGGRLEVQGYGGGGGGSILIACSSFENNGTLNVAGGTGNYGISAYVYAGDGGAGLILIDAPVV